MEGEPARPGVIGMSAALDRVRDLSRAGFGCLPHYDQDGQMIAVHTGPARASDSRITNQYTV